MSLGIQAKSVVFTLSDGSLAYYLLGGEKNPMMRFVDGKVTVDDNVYELSDIKNFYISDTDDPNGVESVASDLNTTFKANCFVMKGKAGDVSVSGVNGAKVSANVTATDGYVSIDLNALPKGAYIINVGKSSFKVMKK